MCVSHDLADQCELIVARATEPFMPVERRVNLWASHLPSYQAPVVYASLRACIDAVRLEELSRTRGVGQRRAGGSVLKRAAHSRAGAKSSSKIERVKNDE